MSTEGVDYRRGSGFVVQDGEACEIRRGKCRGDISCGLSCISEPAAVLPRYAIHGHVQDLPGCPVEYGLGYSLRRLAIYKDHISW